MERLTPERRKERTRTALLDAAAEVFSRRGFNGASLEEIADTAGFTRGAIYKNFEDKEDLFLAVLDRRIEAQLAGFSDALSQGGAAVALDADKMAAAWREIGGTEEWAALDLEFRLFALRHPEAQERLTAHERRFRDEVTAFVAQQSKAMGVKLSIPAATLAGIVIPASLGFFQYRHLDPDGKMFAAFLDLLMATAIEPADAPPAARTRSRAPRRR